MARAMAVVGDRWSILILREAYYGTRRFDEFEYFIGVAPNILSNRLKRFVDAGAYMIMIESEGITENVKTWRTDVVAKIINALRLDVRCDFPSSV